MKTFVLLFIVLALGITSLAAEVTVVVHELDGIKIIIVDVTSEPAARQQAPVIVGQMQSTRLGPPPQYQGYNAQYRTTSHEPQQPQFMDYMFMLAINCMNNSSRGGYDCSLFGKNRRSQRHRYPTAYHRPICPPPPRQRFAPRPCPYPSPRRCYRR